MTPMVTAATRALRFQRAVRNADVLIGELLDEKDPSRRWVVIDAILAVADPGDSHRPFPRWVSEAFGSSLYLERDYVTEKLKKRRKKLEEEATKRDKKQASRWVGDSTFVLRSDRPTRRGRNFAARRYLYAIGQPMLPTLRPPAQLLQPRLLPILLNRLRLCLF